MRCPAHCARGSGFPLVSFGFAKRIPLQSLTDYTFYLKNIQPRPLLMNNIGQKSEFIILSNAVFLPIISQFIAGFLSRHSLRNPLFASSFFLPIFACAIHTQTWILDFLQTLISHFGQPLLKRLRFGRRNRLNNPKDLFYISNIGLIKFSIFSR